MPFMGHPFFALYQELACRRDLPPPPTFPTWDIFLSYIEDERTFGYKEHVALLIQYAAECLTNSSKVDKSTQTDDDTIFHDFEMI